jgi:hypothetical protein
VTVVNKVTVNYVIDGYAVGSEEEISLLGKPEA